MSAWHTIRSISRVNREGTTTSILLERWQTTTPDAPVPKLLLLNDDYKIKFSFTEDYGPGVMSRSFAAAFQNTAANNIAPLFLEEFGALVRLRIVIGTREMFAGYCHTESITLPFGSKSEDEFTFKVDFAEAFVVQKQYTTAFLHNRILQSSNPQHLPAKIPLADLLAEYIFENSARQAHPLYVAHNWSLFYNNASQTMLGYDWVRRLCIDLTALDSGMEAAALLRELSFWLGFRLGWSFTKNCWALVDTCAGAAGVNPVTDASLPATYDLNPAKLNKVASGVRTFTTDTFVFQDINSASGKKSGGTKKLYPSWMGAQVVMPGDFEFWGMYNDYILDVPAVFKVERQSVALPPYENTVIYDGTYKAVDFFKAWWEYRTSTILYPGVTHRAADANLAWLRFMDRVGFDATFQGIFDPMFPLRWGTGFGIDHQMLWITEGAWDIVQCTTDMVTCSFGNTQEEIPTPVSLGVDYYDWFYSTPPPAP